MSYKQSRLLGFHFRRSKSGDRIGIKQSVTVKDKGGKSHTRERLVFEELYNPVCVFHKPHTIPPSDPACYRVRRSSNDHSIIENWHNNRIYQAALREARDRAAGYFHKRGCWNPSKEELIEEERSFLMSIYMEIHTEE